MMSSLLFLFLLTTVASQSCDRCYFDDNDAAGCKDYGQLDGDVYGWTLASQDCLNAYMIKQSAPDPGIVCISANSFVNAVKNDSTLGETKAGLGVKVGGFFNNDGTLKDSITIAGTTTNCETSSTDCYNAMKGYFADNADGQKEMKDVCDQLQNKVFNARQLEQSLARTRICTERREGNSIPDACSTIFAQLEPHLATFSSRNCGFFGVGIQNKSVPGCEDRSTSATTSLVATTGATLLLLVLGLL